MKLFLRSLMVGILCFALQNSYAQLSGSYSIPGAYPTLAAAITDLNTQGVSGAVTFTLTANETAPVGGYVINSFTGASATNTVTINASSGVVITAYTGTASGTTAATKLDAIFYLNGCDYVTLDGLTLQEDAANTTAAQWMEYGIAMVAPNATDGVQYCTIKNCSISLTRSYAAISGFQTPIGKNGNTAIYAAQHTMNNSTEVVPTSAAGAHSFNTFTNNTISNVFNGICLIGHNSATANLPTGNVIGGAAGAGNNLIDFGTTLTGTASAGSAHGIRIRSQINCNISYNTLNTTANPHTGTGHLFGIFLNGGSALTTITTNNNTISLGMNGSTTNTMFCMRSEQVATWTAENNVIENCVYNSATTGGFVGINIFGAYTTVNINNNKIRNNNIYSSTTTSAAFNGFGAESGTGTTLNCNNNEMTNNTIEGTGIHYYFRASGTITTANVNNNKNMNNTFPRSGTRYHVFVAGGSTCATQMNNNVIKKLTFPLSASNYILYPSSTGTCQIQNNLVDSITTNGTGLTYCVYGFPSGTTTMSGNMISNISNSSTGTIYGAYMSTATYTMENNTMRNINGGGTIWCWYGVGGGTMGTIRNNTIQNVVNSSSATTHTVYGIYLSGTNFTVNNNTIRNVKNLCSTTGSTSGIYPVSATTCNIYNNIVDSLYQPLGTTGRISGYWAAGGTTMNVYNNVFSNIEGGTTTDGSALNGLLVTATSGTHNFYNNTVRLGGTVSAGGASGLLIAGNATVNAINNIFDVNVTTSLTTRTSAVIRKTATATGTYAATSNNNMYWIPDATNHFYYIEGLVSPFTNGYSPNATPVAGTTDASFNTACSQYKIFMSGRESGSFYEQTTFAGNVPTGTTRAESGGQSIATVTTDITGAARGATPDIGAYEFAGTAISGADVTPPLLSYTNLSNSICNTYVPLTVTITDASGVNVAAGSKPRVWYKKSTELDVLPASNTSADNGWKYVEATNSTSPFTFNIDLLQLNSLAVAGDVIQYFVAAQDNAGNVALNTVGLFGGYCTTTMSLPPAAFPTAAAPTKKSFTILAQPTSLTAVSSAPSICISGAVTMSLTGGVATGAEYQWQSSDSSTGTFSDISGANGATYTTTLSNSTQHRNFQCVVKCGGSPIITSSVVSVGYANPEVLSTQGASRCGTGTLDLQATISANATANWYAAATGGVPIGTGTTFTTPAIAANTTYYIAASEGGATSTVGRPPVVGTTPCGTSATAGTDWPIRFNTTTPVTISQVSVIPTAAGTFTVALRPTLSTTNLQTASFTFTAAQVGIPQVINLGFSIPTAGQYQLSNTVGGSYRIGTYSSTGACAYPFNSALGGLSIVGSATSSTSATNTTTYNMFYDFVVQEGCESPRQAVTATVVQPPAITMPANITMCSNDPAQTLTVSSSNAGYTYEWGPAAGLNTTTGATVQALPSSTTKYTVTATDNSGGAFNTCATTGDVTVTVNEIPSASDTKASKDTVCFADNVTFSLQNTGNAVGLTYQWQNSANGTTYVNVAGATAPTLTALVDATTNNYYQCVISCKGNPVLTSTPKQVFANTPTIVSTTGATRCGTGSVDLQATVSANHSAKWYASATGGIALGSGSTFTTPQISATTDFYVAASGGGLAPTTIPGDGNWNHFTATGGFQTTTITGAYMILTVLQPLNLLSLDIYPSQAVGTAFTIEARTTSASGPMYASYSGTTTVQNTGTPTVAQTVPVNFSLQPGTYYIGFPTTNPGCWRSGLATHTFPWTLPGVCSMDYYLTPSYQYYFYNLLVGTGCESPRQAVTATVTPSPGMTVTSDVTICSNDTGVALTATSSNSNYAYTWGPAAGLSASTGATVTANPATTTQYTVTGTDAGTGCADVALVKVSVNQVPTSADVKATVDTVCFSGNTLLSLINTTPSPSGVNYQWQSSTSATGTFIDISGANAATYNASIATGSDMHYRCNIGCVNSLGANAPTVTSSSKEMFISQPSVASTTPGNRCGTGTVNLSATAGSATQTLSWFANATGGTAIGTGSTFTTPVISTTTDYYVAAIEGSQPASGGRLTNPTTGSSLGAGPRGVIFTTTSATKITELGFLTTGIANTLTVRLYNTGGTAQIGADIPVVIPANAGTATVPVLTTVPVSIDIPAAGTYRIFVTGFNPTGSPLYYEFSGVTGYPYAVGAVANITGSVTALTGAASTTTYYYFYKMTFSTGCESPRQAVTATVNTAAAITVSPDVTTCSAGPSQTLSISSANSNYVYTWAPATGLSATTGATVSALPPSTTTYSVTADDASTGCVEVGSVKVTVNPSPNNPVVTTTVNATPCSTVTLLEGTNSHQPSTALMGTGTGANTTTSYPAPVGNYYKGHRHQFIYTKAELDGIGMNLGSVINSISMAINSNTTTTPLSDYTVKIGHTTKSSFPTTPTATDWVDYTTLTTVFNTTSLAQPAGGTSITFPFSAPFAWNGTDNIVIEFVYSNGSASTFTTNHVSNWTTLANIQTLYFRTDGTPGATVADFYAYTATSIPTSTATRTDLTFDYTKPADYTWSPSTNLFTDAALTTPYVAGTPAQKVWSKPPSSTTYTVSAVTPLGCTAAQNAQGTAPANARFVELTGLGSAQVTAASSCDDNGWTNYYYNGKIFFAINWAPTGTLSPQNAIAKNGTAVKAVLDAAIAQCENSNGSKVYAMKRWWNVNASFISQPVNVRFYYDPAEVAQVMTAAGGSAPTFGWFKNNTGAYNQQTMVTGKSGIAGGNITGYAGTLGTDQGVSYVQYDNVSSFSGGTGAATTAEAGLRVAAKVLLSHADPGTGTMDDYVKTIGNFPTSDPYSIAPLNVGFQHVANPAVASTTPLVLATTGNNAIVDWVFLELRGGTSGSTTVEQTRAALIQKDGDVVDVDGVSPVSFFGLPQSKYVAIRHRNHIGFRTDNTVALSPMAATLNFVNNSTAVYGSFPITQIGTSGVYTMNGGDANYDGSIDAFDTITWEVENGLFDDYNNNSDYNMDGSVDAFDSITWELNNGMYQELD